MKNPERNILRKKWPYDEGSRYVSRSPLSMKKGIT